MDQVVDQKLDLGYLLAVAGAAVWTPRPLVGMLDALGSARRLVEFARQPIHEVDVACEKLGAEALARIAKIDDVAASCALAEASSEDCMIVTRSNTEYPPRLLDLCDPPLVLYCRGNLEAFEGRAVAIVGSRAATTYGKSIAGTIAADFGGFGATVVSGLARGIDAAAHRAAIKAGVATIAVLGSGLSALYPPYHSLLADEIVAKGGLIVSEFPPKMPARAHQFPMRNRLVAALADAIVVVEAGTKSGALITARLAAELGRYVFAVPGDVGRSTSEGTNALIKDGVMLTTGAMDIAAVLGWQPRLMLRVGKRMPGNADDEASSILAALEAGGTAIDELCAKLGLDVSRASAELTMLEMQGVVERLPGGLFCPAVLGKA